MALIMVAVAFFAFAVLIMASALAHHLNYEDFDSDDPLDDDPLCDDGCDTNGPEGECSKCGWLTVIAGGQDV